MHFPWSNKKDNPESVEDQAAEEEDGQIEQTTTQHGGPDERTRLLSRDPTWLSPDDPAVSPYNLWSIRALRGLSCLILCITVLWWIYTLISLFVNPPAMHTLGSGFFAFSYTTLTVGYLIIALMFFAVPSKLITFWGLILSLFLLIDMLVTLCVPSLRQEEGWVGLASVIWATLMSIYVILQNWSVARGKREEEERLTGREDTRRPLRQWIAVFAETVVVAVLAIASVLFTACLVLRARDDTLPAPGARYPVHGGGYRVHLACVGTNHHNNNNATDKSGGRGGSGQTLPTILIEGGEDPVEASLQPFINKAYTNHTIPRYCYWDRPGLAWSDNAPSPHSAGMAVDSLSEALTSAGEEGPWILVSAGVGSIYSRIFASRHVARVQGIVLIDPTHEDYLHQIGGPGRGFLLWLRGVVSPLGLDRLVGAVFRGRSREDRVYGRSAYQTGKFIKAKLQENLVARSITSTEALAARSVRMPRTRLVVVSSGIEVRKNERWARSQKNLTGITDRLVGWDVVPDAPHEVWLSSAGRQVLERRLAELVNGTSNGTSSGGV